MIKSHVVVILFVNVSVNMSFFDMLQNFILRFTLSLPHEKIKRHETKDKTIRGDFRGEPLFFRIHLSSPLGEPYSEYIYIHIAL